MNEQNTKNFYASLYFSHQLKKNLMKFHSRREMVSSVLLTEAKKVIVKEVFVRD